MKIVMIHGQNHHGSTYHIGKILAEKLDGEKKEFFLPKDFGQFCVGCTNCFMKKESLCPHYEKLTPITKAMDEADLLIFTSPVYVFHATGSMKAFLDHYGYRWMIHRPEGSMFSKQAVCISTAAGGGMKSTIKDITDSLFFWGVPVVYKLGIAVQSTSFERIDVKIKNKIEKKTTIIANKIKRAEGKVKFSWKTIGLFYIMRMLHKKGIFEVDSEYWKEKGWTLEKRPWKH